MSHPDHRTWTRAAATAATVATVAALTSCSTATQAAPPLPTTTTRPSAIAANPAVTTSPTPPRTTPSLAPSTPTEQAIAQAQDAVRRYYMVMDQIERDPAVDRTRAKEVAISTGLVDAYNEIAFFRSRSWRATGEPLQIVSMDSKVVTLAFKPQQQPPVIPEIKVNVCVDVSKSGGVDASGRSVIPASRKPRGLEHFTVANYTWPDPQDWKILHDEAKDEPCANSAP